MAHYAEVKDGRVINVIVAEEDFIKTLPGKWVQTSYNTRDGVHYGPDGQPDGGVPLRKNYASIGYVYDEKTDAFYPEEPLEFINLQTVIDENEIHKWLRTGPESEQDTLKEQG